MKNVLILAGLLFVSSLVVFGQGYDTMPTDALVVPIGVAGTVYETMELGVRGGTYTLTGIEDPKGWNHQTSHETSTTWVTNRMTAGLVNANPITAALEPGIATGWDISDDSLIITFHLREGLKWSDGEPFTADDVVFTYNDVILNEDVDCNARDGQVLPDGTFPLCEKVDDYTVRFTLSTIYRPILNSLGFGIMPKHALAQYVHKLNPEVPAGTFNETWTLDTPLDELVSIGPYVVTAYQVNVSLTMERNPYFWWYDPAGTQLPYFDKVLLQIVTNQDVSMLKFRNGEVDTYGLRPEDIPILLGEAGGKGFQVLITDLMTTGTTWICPNQDIGLAEGTDNEKRELYRTVKFREALAHLLDKDTMVQNVLNGLGKAQWSNVTVSSPFYGGRDEYGGPITENNAVWFEYDPALAASMLDELGVVDQDGDGWRDLPSGDPLTIEINANDNTVRIAYCLIIQDDFRAVGLNATFQVIDFNTLVNQLLSGTGDIIQLGLTGGVEPNAGKNVYTSCGALHAYRYSACEDPDEVDLRMDELMNLGAGTFDLDEAFEYYVEFQQIEAHQLGYIYLCQQTFMYAYYDYIGNAHLANPNETPGHRAGQYNCLVFDKRLKD
jgi:peptide/nickel transport system substrate-binding protein